MEMATTQNHIHKNPNVCGGKACIKGSRIRVQDIYVWHELQNRSVDEIVTDFPQLSPGNVHAALTYYWDNRDEIHLEMEKAEKLVKEMKKRFSSKLTEKLKNLEANDAVSSG